MNKSQIAAEYAAQEKKLAEAKAAADQVVEDAIYEKIRWAAKRGQQALAEAGIKINGYADMAFFGRVTILSARAIENGDVIVRIRIKDSVLDTSISTLSNGGDHE